MGRVWVPAAAVVAVTVGGFVLLDPLTSSLQSAEQLPITPVTVEPVSIPAVTADSNPNETVSFRNARGARSTAVRLRTKTRVQRVPLTFTSSAHATALVASKATVTTTTAKTKTVKKKKPVSHKPVSGDGERNGSSGLADATSHTKIPTVGAQSLAPPR